MSLLQRDLIFITDQSPLPSLQKIFNEDVQFSEDDQKMIASVSRLAAAVFAVSILFISSSWIACGVVWILSHDLYSTARYVHDGDKSQWQQDCAFHTILFAYSKFWFFSLFRSPPNVSINPIQQVFWDGVKNNLISFKVYAFIKKRLN